MSILKTKLVNQENQDPIIQKGQDPNAYIESKALEVRLRYEEDIASAYRDFYRDQVVTDKRNELGRFLFAVSVSTIGFFISILKMATQPGGFEKFDLFLIGVAGFFLLISLFVSLRLAIPKNQDVNPVNLELVEHHRSNVVELSRFSYFWFLCWIIGLVFGLVVIIE